jgi:hypothetical protein
MSSTVETVQTSVDQIVEALKTLSFADLVNLQVALATTIRSEAKKTTRSTKTVKDPSKPRKALPAKMRAWQAFVSHLESVQPALFADCKKLPEKQTVAKAYRVDHEAEYTAFVEQFLANITTTPAVTTSNVSSSNAAPAPAPEPKVKAVKVPKEPKASKEEKPVKEKKAKKEADVDKPKAEKKTTKKAAAKAEPVADAPVDTKWIEIEDDGMPYIYNSTNNDVFEYSNETIGMMIGKYNTTTKTIDFIESV